MNRFGAFFRSPVTKSLFSGVRNVATQAPKTGLVNTARLSPAQLRAAAQPKVATTFANSASFGFSLVETLAFGPQWIVAYRDALIFAFREIFQALRPIMAMVMGSTLVKSAFSFSMSKLFLFFFSFIAIFETGYIFLQLYIRQAFLEFFASP